MVNKYRLIDAGRLGRQVAELFVHPNISYWQVASLVELAPTVEAVEIPKSGIGDVSDGYHTFNELYHHRAVLFSVICNLHPLCSWKSKKHSDGTMYDGMFIVGINTPEGQATYHYDINPYWDMFKVPETEFAPEWDGHTAQEAIKRIGSLEAADAEPGWWEEVYEGLWRCTACGVEWCFDAGSPVENETNFCPCCGKQMAGERRIDHD